MLVLQYTVVARLQWGPLREPIEWPMLWVCILQEWWCTRWLSKYHWTGSCGSVRGWLNSTNPENQILQTLGGLLS